jgi:hypothetical protein
MDGVGVELPGGQVFPAAGEPPALGVLVGLAVFGGLPDAVGLATQPDGRAENPPV